MCLIKLARLKARDPETNFRRANLVKAVNEFDSDPFIELDEAGVEQARNGAPRRRWSDSENGWS